MSFLFLWSSRCSFCPIKRYRKRDTWEFFEDSPLTEFVWNEDKKDIFTEKLIFCFLGHILMQGIPCTILILSFKVWRFSLDLYKMWFFSEGLLFPEMMWGTGVYWRDTSRHTFAFHFPTLYCLRQDLYLFTVQIFCLPQWVCSEWWPTLNDSLKVNLSRGDFQTARVSRQLTHSPQRNISQDNLPPSAGERERERDYQRCDLPYRQ